MSEFLNLTEAEESAERSSVDTLDVVERAMGYRAFTLFSMEEF